MVIYSTPAGQHQNDVIMSAMASRISSLTIIYWSVYSGVDQRKHQSSASLAFVSEIHRWPVNPPPPPPRHTHIEDQQRGKCFPLMTSSWVACVCVWHDMCHVSALNSHRIPLQMPKYRRHILPTLDDDSDVFPGPFWMYPTATLTPTEFALYVWYTLLRNAQTDEFQTSFVLKKYHCKRSLWILTGVEVIVHITKAARKLCIWCVFRCD